MSHFRQISLRTYIIATIVLLFATANILFLMGRVPWCTCGTIKLWYSANGPENSQHIADFYTFSHIIHGFLFYFFLWKFLPKIPLLNRALLALFPEIIWELIENSNMIIDHYRQTTVSINYYGDSVLNSVCDILAMVLGFWIAARLPVWATICLVLLMEICTAYLIRDNLTLNVIMIIFPLQSIKQWQMGK